jgi:hypothetical protein
MVGRHPVPPLTVVKLNRGFITATMSACMLYDPEPAQACSVA